MRPEARRRARCDAFGAPDFRARLDAAIAAVDADADLGPLGRMVIQGRTIRLLTARLLVEALLRRRPEILDLELPAPIVVFGLPRSGTTHLVNPIAATRRLRSLPFWDTLEP